MPKQWSLVDFVLVILGGFLGVAVVAGITPLLGDGELRLILLLVGQYLGEVLVIWLLARSKEDPDLGLEVVGRDTLYLGLGVGLQLALALLFYPLAVLFFPEGESAQQVVSTLTGLQSTWARVAAVAIAVALAPAVEEVIFRGVLLKSLERQRRATVMVVTSLVFASMHLLGLEQDKMLQAAALVLPQLFLVGLVLAWVTLRSGRLGPAIFLHSGFNLLGVVVVLIPPELLESVG